MSRLTVTEKDLADVKRKWTGKDLFDLSNPQLREIIEARGLFAESDANKKMLVKVIMDGGPTRGPKDEDAMTNEGGVANNSEGDLEVAEANKASAASSLREGEVGFMPGEETNAVGLSTAQGEEPVGEFTADNVKGPVPKGVADKLAKLKEEKKTAKFTVASGEGKASAEVVRPGPTHFGHIDDLVSPLEPTAPNALDPVVKKKATSV